MEPGYRKAWEWWWTRRHCSERRMLRGAPQGSRDGPQPSDPFHPGEGGAEGQAEGTQQRTP
jgi:hypothetical protein